MRILRPVALTLATAVLAAGCGDEDFMIPDLNNAGLEQLATSPTRAIVVDAAQGLMIGARLGVDGQTGYVSELGILGRESLVFDQADPRFIDQLVTGDLDNGDGAFGGSQWDVRYNNAQLATVLLGALDIVDGFTDTQLEAIRGWTKFFLAHDLLLVVNTRGANGAVAQPAPFGADLAPLVGEEVVFDRIETLLTESVGHLQNGGAAFPFQVSSGFAEFDTPGDLVPAVRALHARVGAYREDYSQALTLLNQSFLDRGASLDLGTYHSYGTGSGDNQNNLFQGADPQIVAFPSQDDDAQLQPGGEPDARAQAKLDPLADPKVDRGVTSDVRFSIYNSLSAPIPIIRNEELILLRAEARWFTGDRLGAMDDLNFIRTTSGGLAPIIAIPVTDSAFIEALLYERRYSLMFEGGHRWIDHRRFGLLDQLEAQEGPRAGDQIPSAFPIPQDECLARDAGEECQAPIG